jgi:hypothetical protein
MSRYPHDKHDSNMGTKLGTDKSDTM